MDLKKNGKNTESQLLEETQMRVKKSSLTFVFLEVQVILLLEKVAKMEI